MVERVLQLNDRTVRTLMTPRPDIRWLNLEDSPEINRNKIINSSHTRFPVCQGSLDEVLGIVQATYLLADCLEGKAFDLTTMLRTPLYVPESTKGLRILESFQESGSHIALVVDEYGVIQGLITINDILQAIVGDLPRIDRQATFQFVERADGSWLVDGSVAIEELEKRFSIADLPEAAQGNFYTLGGFVAAYLGKIPAPADCFIWENFRFEVVDMDGNRVDKVLMTPLATELAEIKDGVAEY
jgi:putative hemolysin